MLTRRQLSGISAREGVALQTIERDYIQTLYLYELYKHNTDFLFKGGTCLRMGYKLNRYSEDLDFNYNLEPLTGKKILTDTAAKLSDFGIEATLKVDNEFPLGFRCKLRYKGPLYVGKELSVGSVKLDISCRKEKVDTTSKMIRPVYDDCPSYAFKCLTVDHLFTEKIRALIIRGKPRDLYDVWFFRESATYDVKLLNEKLKIYDMRFEEVDIDTIFSKIEEDWEQDIKPLLGFLPDFQTIAREVVKKLKEIQMV